MGMKLERQALQAAIAVCCLVPLLAGGAGVLSGPAMIGFTDAPADLDSHFRYLSGLLLALGIGFLSCVPDVEAKGRRFRLLGAIVLVGGLGRSLSLIHAGLPGPGHMFGLGMELVVTPLLMLWQWRVERLCGALARPVSTQAKGPPDVDPTTPLYMASDRK